MKKLVYLTLMLAVGLSASAQDLAGRSIIKTDLTSYALATKNPVSSINVNYEFKLSDKFSVGMVGGVLLSNTKTLKASGTRGTGQSLAYEGEITPHGFFINPYARMYTGEAMTGFYVELFTRYYSYDFKIPYDYDKDGQSISANADASASAIGGGLAIGIQVPIGPMFYLDFYAGAGMGLGQAHAETNDPNLDEQDYADIKKEMDELEDPEIIFVSNVINDMTYDASTTKAWADIENYAVPMLRGGISFGIKF